MIVSDFIFLILFNFFMRDSLTQPLLPKWPFYISNGLLVFFAIFLAFSAKENLSPTHIFWCICAVFLGAILFVYPFLQEFKAYVSLQQSKHTALSKEQAQRLDHTLYQLQEIRENILENHHKQSLDQALITSTLQTLEERLSTILNKNQNEPSVYSEKTSLDSLETKMQSLLDMFSLSAAYVEPSVKGSEPRVHSVSDEGLAPQAEGPAPTFLANPTREPVPPFFRAHAAEASLSPLDETIQSLYPNTEAEKTQRSVFPEAAETLSSNIDNTFAFDFDNLVPQNLFSARDSIVDMSTDEKLIASFDADFSSLDSNASFPLAVEEAKQIVGETSVVVVDHPSDKEQTYNPAQGTTLTVHANLGIGKKPYIRGQGPGLNWSYGAPMAFIEIGKWQWTAPDSSQPIICRIYKSDEVPAEGEVLCLQPGEQVELSPVFRG